MVRAFTDKFDRRMDEFLEDNLEIMTFEEFVEEKFDMTVSEVFLNMYYSGLIDDEDLKTAGFIEKL